MAMCKEKVKEQLKERMTDLAKLWYLYCGDSEASDPDLGQFQNYGLGFDYVAPGTFAEQRRGYFRYQLSCGGPSDEFRFFCDEGFRPVRIEYWYLEWFDGAKIVLKGKDESLLQHIFENFRVCDVGTFPHTRYRSLHSTT